MHRVFILILFFCLGLQVPVAQAAVQASIDRTQVNLNETFTLELSTNDMDADAPDLKLPEGLKILRRSSLSSRSLVNGKATSEQRWKYQLVAQTAGDYRIPEQRIGDDKTAAITLKVLAPSESAKPQLGAGQKILLRAELDATTVLPQQQVLLTVKLMSAVPVRFAQLSEPNLSGVSVHLLEPDSKYETESNGLRYTVLERRYALFANQPGDYQLPALQFNGDINARRETALGGFFDDTEPVMLQSAPLSFSVQEAPSPAQPALPAKQFNWQAELSPGSAKPQVGEPLTLTVTTDASGQIAANLPALALVDNAQFKVYPDQPVDTVRSGQDGVSVRRTQKFAIVPLQPGPLAWPQITQRWRPNAAADEQLAELALPALEIAPAPKTTAATGNEASGSAPAPAQMPDAATDTAPVATGTTLPLWFWPVLSALLALGNLVFAGLWWRSRTGSASAAASAPKDSTATATLTEGPALKQLRAACTGNDAKAAQSALLAYAQAIARRHGLPAEQLFSHWHNLHAHLPAWAGLLDTLEAAQFGASKTRWQGGDLLAALPAIGQELHKIAASLGSASSKETQPLPTLVP